MLIPKNKNELDQILDQHITDGSYPFLYAHIENIDGDILYQHSTVNKDIFPALSVNKDTWIRIWSMSKIVTIAIIMDLVEENIIQLNDSVSDYIPEFSNLKVAQSSSGVSLSRYTNADFVSNPEMVDKIDACPITLAETDSIMKIIHLINHKAGFYYADTRISCLDSLSYKADIPAVTGRDGHLRYAKPGELDIMGNNVPKYDPDQPLFLGGEGMLATADSYADFLRLLLNNGKLNHHRFLDETTLKNMLSNIDRKDEHGISTGFGLLMLQQIASLHYSCHCHF